MQHNDRRNIFAAAAVCADMYIRYRIFVSDQIKDRYRIHYALKCAQRHSDEELLKYVEKASGRDINLYKVGCSDEPYWTNLLEIRAEPENGPRLPDFNALFGLHVDPSVAISSGVLSTLAVIGLGLLLVIVRRIAAWVVGAGG